MLHIAILGEHEHVKTNPLNFDKPRFRFLETDSEVQTLSLNTHHSNDTDAVRFHFHAYRCNSRTTWRGGGFSFSNDVEFNVHRRRVIACGFERGFEGTQG